MKILMEDANSAQTHMGMSITAIAAIVWIARNAGTGRCRRRSNHEIRKMVRDM